MASQKGFMKAFTAYDLHKNILTLPAPIPDKEKRLNLNFYFNSTF